MVASQNVAGGHGLVVVGGSAGCVEVLRGILAKLPSDFAAAIYVVIHVSPTRDSRLPALFRGTSALPVSTAVDRTVLQPGHVYIAPPDHHVVVTRSGLRVVRGPKENGFRPAVDVLFRSAAVAYGPGVVGVVLSGGPADGVRGARVIRQSGGRLIAQDPAEAQFPEMPRDVEPFAEFVVESEEIPGLLVTLMEKIMQVRDEEPRIDDEAERLTEYTCPECGGVLTELADGMTYRCHVGHAYSADSLLAHGHETIEAGLWRAIRIINEQAKLLRALGAKMTAQRNPRSADRFIARATEAEQSVEILRHILLSSTVLDLSEDDFHADHPAHPGEQERGPHDA
jgi:two-component system, chemotaxis family, protein-glutamate methylesterase/glutaminase